MYGVAGTFTQRLCQSAPLQLPCLRRPPQYVGSMHGDEPSNGVLLLLLVRELCVGPRDGRVQVGPGEQGGRWEQVGAGCLSGLQMEVGWVLGRQSE